MALISIYDPVTRESPPPISIRNSPIQTLANVMFRSMTFIPPSKHITFEAKIMKAIVIQRFLEFVHAHLG
jgi:hypothetical protein